MNFKKSALASAITLATFATGAAAFDASSWEVSGFVKNETAFLQKDGTFNGQSTGPTDTTEYNDQGDVIKFENTLKLFVNGVLGENADLHAELNFVADPESEGSHTQTHLDYSQTDYLRELYIDSVFGETGDIEVRFGKQQVVWGTADGAKLLDIINPTDYRELAQNTMEDSRVPVWMLKVDANVGESGNVQLIAAQPRENVFAGLDRNVDTSVRVNESPVAGVGIADRVYEGHSKGSPYIMKGVDSITGRYNGFVNIVPDLGSTAANFASAFEPLGGATFGGMKNPLLDNFTVGAFTSGATLAQLDAAFDMMQGGNGDVTAGAEVNFADLNFATQLDMALGGNGDLTVWNAAKGTMTGKQALEYFGNLYETNLYNPDAPINSAYEYMDRTPFTTFDDFVMAKSQYKYDMPSNTDLDMAFRYKNGLDNGFNYSLNYAYSYEKNPIINLSWRNDAGERLIVTRTAANLDLDMDGTSETNSAVISLSDSDGNNYGGNEGREATLVFEQTEKRAHNIGASFDYTVDTESLGGVVLRGEFLYQKDVYSPVMDRGALSIGDLPAALTMRKGDRFKYVLGADITVLTNMLVSGQFIQDRNLDYIDDNTDWDGSSCAGKINCGTYTTDYATMHLTNQFNKARENKNFYSLFLSKPFGPNQLGRWNNILMAEQGGGYWNRFDIEYSFTDNVVGLFELNNYWGDDNTQFGQLEDASNVQVGFKYLF